MDLRFTARARKIMQLANQECQRFNHQEIDTEHILLGLVKEGVNEAATMLKDLGIHLRTIRLEVEKHLESGPEMITMGKMPKSEYAKQVIEIAIQESEARKHDSIGTSHLVLGLITVSECGATKILSLLLQQQDLNLSALRDMVLNKFKQEQYRDLAVNDRASHIFNLSRRIAIRRGDPEFDTQHLLMAILEEGKSDATFCLSNAGLDRLALLAEISERIPSGSESPTPNRISMTADFKKVLVLAQRIAKSLRCKFVNAEHLFLALLESPDNQEFKTTEILSSLEIDIANLKSELETYVRRGNPASRIEKTISLPESPDPAPDKDSALYQHAINLTLQAKFQYYPALDLDLTVIDQTLRTLIRRNKNNVLLVGDRRLGELYLNSIADLLVSNKVPEALTEHSMYKIVNFLAENACFLTHLIDMLNQAKQDGNVVLAFDNFVELFTFSAPQSPKRSIAGTIVPWLKMSSVKTIGLAEEWQLETFLSKADVTESFEIIVLSKSEIPPIHQMIDQTIRQLETYHLCNIPPETVELAIDLCTHYQHESELDQTIADSVIGLLDQAAADTVIGPIIPTDQSTDEDSVPQNPQAIKRNRQKRLRDRQKRQRDRQKRLRASKRQRKVKSLNKKLNSIEREMQCCQEDGKFLRLSELHLEFERVLSKRVELSPLVQIESDSVISTLAEILNKDKETIRKRE